MRLAPHQRFYLDLVFMPTGLCKVVRHLNAQPRLRIAAKRLAETDCHIRRNAALAVHKVVEGLPGYA